MNETRDTGTVPADDGGEFDPRDAATIMQDTRQQARRRFEPHPPLLTILTAILILVAYGAVWLSVRDQHPYKGPTGIALLVLYGIVLVVIVVSIAVRGRANAGVRGPSRSRPGEIAVLAIAWVSVYVFQGALRYAGVAHAFVYGIYPATAPLIMVGLVGAAIAQARANWPVFAGALTAAIVAVGAAYAGPAVAWLVAGIGVFVALLTHAGMTAWRQRT